LGFVHLHVHSHYSLLDGAIKVGDIVRMAAELGMPAIAITDHGNMFGAMEFYVEAKAAGIKPIIGCELYVAKRSRFDRDPKLDADPDHLIVLVMDERGYKNLMKLTSIGHLEGYYYKPRVDKEVLSEHSDGLIAMSSCIKGEIPRLVISGDMDKARKALAEYVDIFGKDRFFLEIQRHGIEEEEIAIRGYEELSRDFGLRMIATNDVHYLLREHSRAHEILLCIQTQTTISDPGRFRFRTDQFHFRTEEEMREVFRDLPKALDATLDVAEMCDLELDLSKVYLPEYRPPEGYTLEGYLEELVWDGFRRRYPDPPDGAEERLKMELSVIKKMGFSGYFLIVWDYIKFAKDNGIMVGPGRGSSVGSLVSYCLGITNVDPIRYGLIFERFLNPERVEMPDIDSDFDPEGLETVRDYVRRRYGEGCVAQIITFGTMAARAAVRDVGRALDLPYQKVDVVAKMIPMGLSVSEALEIIPELRSMARESEETRLLLDIASSLEGLARHASVHAGGIVIAPGELTDYVPLFRGANGKVTTQYDKDSLRYTGVIKMDLLGVDCLTVIREALRLIKERHGVEIDMDKIPLDDPKTYELLGEGRVEGIFQVESRGMRELLRRMRPTSFEDLIALIALYRPGPMQMIDEFIKRKHGLVPIEYPHPALEPILSETYGIIVYQEQIMRIAHDLAGFTMAQADILRSAMAKKKRDVMERMRPVFVEGAVKRGVSRDVAERIFGMMEAFAEYGFNKSHSAAYALVCYQTAYLKAHYPLEYMAARMSIERGEPAKLIRYIRECQGMGIEVCGPDINKSSKNFTVEGDKRIRMGLSVVRNAGDSAIEAIMEGRKGGDFKSLFDFCERVDLKVVNRRVIESLIKCGAFDCLGPSRAFLLGILDRAIERGQRVQRDRAVGQTSFLDFGMEEPEEPLPEIKEWTEKYKFAMEKEVLGFYISGHPLKGIEEEARKRSTATTSELPEMEGGTAVSLVGIVSSIRGIMTRNGKRMGFISLQDLDGSVEVVVRPELYERKGGILREDEILLVKGRVDLQEDGDPILVAEEIERFSEVMKNAVSKMVIEIDCEVCSEDMLLKLRDLLLSNKGECLVEALFRKGKEMVIVSFGPRFRVTPSEELLAEVEKIFGKGSVHLVS
jgi:DNA polymerase-3 subunit alpha